MSEWRVKALIRGRLEADKSIVLSRTDMGERIWEYSSVYYLSNGDQNVLIDTGYGDADHLEEVFSLFRLEPEQSLESLLKEEAVPPEEIDTVILSHLHWDHAGNVDLFDDTTTDIFVHRDAAKRAFAPLDINAKSFLSPTAGYTPSWKDTQLQFIDGTTTLAPGLKAIDTPGHAPGHLSFLVQTEFGICGLAIDVFPLYANIEGNDTMEFQPPGCIDLEAWWHSARQLNREADYIVPSHDLAGPANEWIDKTHCIRKESHVIK